MITFVFGLGVPVLFTSLQIGETVTLFAMGLGASYLGANAISSKWGTQ